MNRIDTSLREYIEAEILPQYEGFDDAHGKKHVNTVIDNSLQIAGKLNEDLDYNMIYTIAAYHDLGQRFGREKHEITSAALLLVDEKLREWFDLDEMILMKEAVEDHRASLEYEPRSIYGRIVGDADRLQPAEGVIERCMQYSKKHCPDYTFEQHVKRCLDHVEDKYCKGGYMRLWIVKEEDFEELSKLRGYAADYDKFAEICAKYH